MRALIRRSIGWECRDVVVVVVVSVVMVMVHSMVFLNQFLKIQRKQFKEAACENAELHHCSFFILQICHDLLQLFHVLQLLHVLQLFFCYFCYFGYFGHDGFI